MTLFLGPEQVRGLVDQKLAYEAMESVCEHQIAGTARLPTRLDVTSANGFLRVMPAVLGDAMGLKVMTLAEGHGTRYLVVLCDVESGEVRALVDADEVTRLRTGAVSALAGRLLASGSPHRLGLIGSGFEAVGQLRALAWSWPLVEVLVFSPNQDRRAAFAAAMSSELGIEVRPVASAKEAVAQQQVVVLATKSREAVIDGAVLDAGTVVLSIGSTRPDLRELDEATLARAAVVVGDDRAHVLSESGDLLAAVESGDLDPARVMALSAIWSGEPPGSADGDRDLRVFKSVGTALQDLAVARAAVERSRAHADGARQLGDLATLKPFADGA